MEDEFRRLQYELECGAHARGMRYLVRPHRYTLREAMAEAQPCRDIEHLAEIIRNEGAGLKWNPLAHVTADQIEIEPYGGWDSRIGWDTYLITIKDWGVWGMANGPLTASGVKL